MNKNVVLKLFQALFLLFLFVSNISQAMPKIRTEFGRSFDGTVRIKVHNETRRELACYIAVNGKKNKFRLLRLGQSKWYKATDKRTNYKQFSTWCDYIEYHREYSHYK